MGYGALRRPKDGIYRAKPGDTISSIAATFGFTDWEAKVWDASENAKLKEQRKNPNTLAPGDEVFIPELTKKEESRPTDEWHDFHVIRNKRFLRLKIQNEKGEPIKDQKYEIRPVASFRGTFVQQGQTTDPEGRIEEEIPHTLLEAELILPDAGLYTRLKIGFLQPLPMAEKEEADAGLGVGGVLDAAAGAFGGLAGSASGALGGLAGAAAGAAGSAAGSAAGNVTGGLSGGVKLGSGGVSSGGGGSAAGGLAGGISGAAGALGGLAGQAQGAASGLMGGITGAASSIAGVAGKAVGNVLGPTSFGNEVDPNIYPAAQRLVSMGFDAGDPKDNRRTAAFSAALMAFQTWCKEKGSISEDAGGPLGGLTSPGGMLGGGGGALGAIAGAVAGPMLAAVGLTGQLDEETIDALKKVHGC